MNNNYKTLRFLKRMIFSVLILSGLTIPSFAQVGFNNPDPDSSALIDMKATDMGLLIPRMDSVAKRIMANKSRKPAHSLLIFDLNNNMFFAYDTISSGWTALNPFKATSSTSDIITATSGNVGIGTNTPTAKLDVNGNINARSTISSGGNISAAGQVSANSVSASSISSSGNISSSGTVTATIFVGNGTIPVGGIIMWSGSPTSIPSGWNLCDGTMGTPNLSNRFILSYGGSSGSVGSTGGQDNVTLSIANLPPHKHNFSDRYANPNGVATGQSRTRACDDTTQGGTTSDGSEHGLASTPFDNRPAYYVLAFIMRVQ